MFYLPFYLLFLSFTSLQCTNSKPELDQQDNIVATIGNTFITSDEFIANYEFGFAHLKSPNNPKLSYLNAMINEKLLSIDGYENNVHLKNIIQNKKNDLSRDLLIEYLIKEEVKESITITDSEIKDAINKSKVSFNMRYWAHNNLEIVNQTYDKIREVGFERFIQNIIESNQDLNLSQEQFETGYVTWLTIPPELVEKIQDLPIKKISEPVQFGGKYWIFEIIDIRREGILDSEYFSRAESFRKILFQNKLSDATTNYVSSLMTQKDVRTKMESFKYLSNIVWKWLTSDSEGKLKFEQYLHTHLNVNFENMKNNLLISTTDSQISINDFIQSFDFFLLGKDFSNKNAMMQQLNLEIAWFIRDKYLVKTALDKQINTSPDFKRELELWIDKWVYEESRRSFSPRELSLKLNELKTTYPVKIDTTLLNSLEVTGSIKSRWLTVHNYKMGTNRMAIPIADGSWKLSHN